MRKIGQMMIFNYLLKLSLKCKRGFRSVVVKNGTHFWIFDRLQCKQNSLYKIPKAPNITNWNKIIQLVLFIHLLIIKNKRRRFKLINIRNRRLFYFRVFKLLGNWLKNTFKKLLRPEELYFLVNSLKKLFSQILIFDQPL